MKRILLLVVLFCLLLTAGGAEAAYKLFVQPQIVPQFVQVWGAGELVWVLNLEGLLPLPANVVYKPDGWNDNRYLPDPAGRTLLYQTAGEGDSDAAIFAALPHLRAWKEKLLRADGDYRIKQLDGVYLSGEKATWPNQREEAARWGGDGFQSTPFCDMIAAAAGIPREEYIATVKASIGPYDASVTAILGTQIALIRDMYAADTVAEVVEAAWPVAAMVNGYWTPAQ